MTPAAREIFLETAVLYRYPGLAGRMANGRPRAIENSTAGLNGFDFVCRTKGSGPRTSRHLVNDRGNVTSANEKRTDFALAA